MSVKQILLILVSVASMAGIALSDTSDMQVGNITPTATAICDPCGNFTPVVTATNTPTPNSTDTPNITVTSTPNVTVTDTPIPIITVTPDNTPIPTVTSTNTPVPNQKITVILTFDDGWLTVYTKAYPILKANNQAGVVFVNIEPVLGGWPDFVSKADLDTMYSSGWDISSHTYSHVDLTTLNDSDLKHELNDTKNWLDTSSYVKSSMFLSYPYGGFNDNVINAMKSYGYLAARIINDTTTYKHYDLNSSDVFMMEDYEAIGGIDNDVSVINQINNAAAINGLLILSFHKIVDNLSTNADDASTEFKVSDFQNVSNYLKSNNINVVTLSDYFGIKPAVVPTGAPMANIIATPNSAVVPNTTTTSTSPPVDLSKYNRPEVIYIPPIPKVTSTSIPKVNATLEERPNVAYIRGWSGTTNFRDSPENVDIPKVEDKNLLERIEEFIMSLIRSIYAG